MGMLGERGSPGVRARPAATLAVAILLIGGPAGCTPGGGPPPVRRLPSSYVPVPFGRGAPYRPPALNPAVAAGRPVAGMACGPAGRRFGVHLELFARRRVIAIPAGIGVAVAQRRGAYVLAGRCSYPARTVESSGVFELARPLTLGAVFAIWGQRLAPTQMLSFSGPVSAYVDGRPWPGDPRAIPLRRHAQVVLASGGVVVPHAVYRFAPGL